MATLLKIVPELRNLVINGNFDFWQRGTSITGRAAGDTSFLADRFKLTLGGTSAVYRMDRSTDVPTFAQSGFQSSYSLAIQVTTADAAVAAGDIVILRQSMEGYDYSQIANGKKFRLQFWAKSFLAGTYCLSLTNDSNNRNLIKEYTLPADTWTRVSMDLTSDTIGTWALDNSAGLQICWTLMAGSTFQGAADTWQAGNLRATSNQANFSSSTSNIFKIAQVAIYPIEASSSTILPFSRAGRTIQQELAMCQRYYEKSHDQSVAPGTSGIHGIDSPMALVTGAGLAFVTFYFKTSKRATPNVVFYDGVGTASRITTQAAGGTATDGRVASAVTAKENCITLQVATSDVRAYGSFTADAEL